MERDRLTFLIISDPSKPAHEIKVSHRALRVAIGSLAGALLFLLAGSAALLLKLGDVAQADRIKRENAILVTDMRHMQETVDQLSQSLTTLSERDRRYRTLAGLPEIDPEVRQVGIGGPGSPSAESEPLRPLDDVLSNAVYGTKSELNRLLRQSNLLQASLQETLTAMESHQDELSTYPSIDPTSGYLSSSFSRSRLHPLLNIRRPHEGIDISAQPGSPIHATADGKVTYAGYRPGYGWTVEIDHGNGLKTRYAHNQKNLKVRVGDRVRRGDTVAFVGSSGNVTGPHVHYEVIKDGHAVNPQDFRLSKVIVD
jgi:murein DD-endopeptidase MepM/ murein hydrolase activator NlpD